jgi:hypothetical protein
VSIIYRLAPAHHWHGISPTTLCLARDLMHDHFIHCIRGLALFLPRTHHKEVM